MNARGSLLLILATAIATPGVQAEAPRPPNFECQDDSGAKFRIWLGSDRSLIEVNDKAKVRQLPLAGANVGRTTAPREEGAPVVPTVIRPKAGQMPNSSGEPLFYNGWNREGEDLYSLLDLSTEFSTQYTVQQGTTRILVSLVIDHKERTGLVCKATGFAATVISKETEANPAERYAKEISLVATQRTRTGALAPIGVLGIEAAIKRMFHSPAYKNKTERARFVELAAPHLKKVDQTSINRITTRIKPPIAEFWTLLLEDIKYKYYPPVTRFTTWVREGARPGKDRDLPSVVAGFNQFVQSPGYADKDVRDFFSSEVADSLKLLSEADVAQAKLTLSNAGESLFIRLWTKSVGKRTLEDAPEIQQMGRDLASLVEDPSFDPQKIQTKISAFLKSPAAGDPESRALYMQAISPIVQKLTPRQREDVMGWLEDEAEKQFLTELLRSN